MSIRNDFLIALIFNPGGTRNIYLPAGDWVDFWLGASYTGQQWLMNRTFLLERMLLFVGAGAEILVYPRIAFFVDEMDLADIQRITITPNFGGTPNCRERWRK